MVAPPLHHLPALRNVLRVVVCGSNAVAFSVGQLPLDDITVESIFVQDGACCRPETVTGSSAVVPHSVDGVEKCVLTDELNWLVPVWEHVLPVVG